MSPELLESTALELDVVLVVVEADEAARLYDSESPVSSPVSETKAASVEVVVLVVSSGGGFSFGASSGGGLSGCVAGVVSAARRNRRWMRNESFAYKFCFTN